MKVFGATLAIISKFILFKSLLLYRL